MTPGKEKAMKVFGELIGEALLAALLLAAVPLWIVGTTLAGLVTLSRKAVAFVR